MSNYYTNVFKQGVLREKQMQIDDSKKWAVYITEHMIQNPKPIASDSISWSFIFKERAKYPFLFSNNGSIN